MKKRRVLLTFGVLALLSVAGFGAILWLESRGRVKEAKLHWIGVGMSLAEVEAILGPPDMIDVWLGPPDMIEVWPGRYLALWHAGTAVLEVVIQVEENGRVADGRVTYKG